MEVCEPDSSSFWIPNYSPTYFSRWVLIFKFFDFSTFEPEIGLKHSDLSYPFLLFVFNSVFFFSSSSLFPGFKKTSNYYWGPEFSNLFSRFFNIFENKARRFKSESSVHPHLRLRS